MHSHTVRNTIHRMNNDYNLIVPQLFQQVSFLGIGVIIVSLLWSIANPSSYGTIAIIVGIVLTLPAVVIGLIVRSALNRRFRVRDGIVDHADLHGDEHVLDVGVGSGITLFGCAKHLTTGKGIGIDIYDPNAGGGSSDIFWKNARKEDVTERVELKNMDARAMSFTDQSFDVVVSTFAFHHIGDAESRRKAAAEIVRILKPGGKVMVYDASMAVNELEQVMREAGFKITRHGGAFSMVMGEKSA